MSIFDGDREEALLDHPERIDIEILGEEYPFLLTMRGLEEAKDMDVEILPSVLGLANRIAGLFSEENEDIELGSPELEEKVKNLVRDEDARVLSIIIWWGLRTFEDDLTLEEVQWALTPVTLVKIVPDVMDKVQKLAEDRLPEDAQTADSGESEGK